MEKRQTEKSRVDDPVPPLPLQNKVALIFGGTGPGREELALSLAEKGADIALVSYRQHDQSMTAAKKQVEATGRRCLAIPVRIADRRMARQLIQRIVRKLGRLDIFIDYAAQSDLENGTPRPTANHPANVFPSYLIMNAALKQITAAT